MPSMKTLAVPSLQPKHPEAEPITTAVHYPEVFTSLLAYRLANRLGKIVYYHALEAAEPEEGDVATTRWKDFDFEFSVSRCHYPGTNHLWTHIFGILCARIGRQKYKTNVTSHK